MAKALRLVNGIPRSVTVGEPLVIKDDGVTIDSNVSLIDFTDTGVTATQTASGQIEVQILGTAAPLPDIYDATTNINAATPAYTSLTLPTSRTYNSDELMVFLNGQYKELTTDYIYVGTAPRTQIQFVYPLVDGDAVRYRIERDYGNFPTIYDSIIDVISGSPSNANEISGPVTAGVDITLPASKTYFGAELEVYLNGHFMEYLTDYAYVGSGEKTAIEFTFDLVVGDKIRFRIDRLP